METFVAEVRQHFEAESVEAAGGALRRLTEVARTVGFDVRDAKVTPAPSEGDREAWTGYAPLDPPEPG